MTDKGRQSNIFVRLLRAVFVSNALTKLVAVLLGGLIWAVIVGMGYGSAVQYDFTTNFFAFVLDNIVAAFSGVTSIIASVCDIVLFIVLVYLLLKFLFKYNAGLLLRFIIPLLIIGLICTSTLLNFPVMGRLFSNIIIIIAFLLLIMFPQELRRGLWKLASPSQSEIFMTQYDCTEEELRRAVVDIVKAVLNMAKDNEGALIAIATQTMPEHVIESGTRLDAVLSQHLIECLFNKKANLHDGAVFIRGNRIVAAGCFLPLTQAQNLPKELGTRHRAAIGVTEQYPVLVIVVSEETGVISICKQGKLERYYDAAMLSDVLEQEFGLRVTKTKKKKGRKSEQ